MQLFSVEAHPGCVVAGPERVLCAPEIAAEAGWWADLAERGIYELVHVPEDSSLGYSSPVLELRDGRQVAIAYALGTQAERAAATLAKLKAQAHDRRTAERIRREAETYPHNGSRFDCDERTAIRWGLVVSMALLAIGQDPSTVIVPSGWRDTEGTPRLYAAAQILAAQQSLLIWEALCDGTSQAISADIDAATDAETVEAIIAAISSDPRWPA